MHEKPQQRFWDKIFNLYHQLAIINLMSIAPISVPNYLQSCHGHFLSGVLPICIKVNGYWTHRTWPSPIRDWALRFAVCNL